MSTLTATLPISDAPHVVIDAGPEEPRSIRDLNLPPIPNLVDVAVGGPDWVRDTDSIRDEGVLAGIAGAPIDAQVQAIRSYFSAQKARARATRESFDRHLEEANSAIVRLHHLLDEATGAIKQVSLTRALAWLVFSVTAAITVTVFVEGLLDGVRRDSWFVAIAVTMVSALGVARPVAWLFSASESLDTSKGDADRWKTIVLEFGMPLAATAFVVAWTPDSSNIAQQVTLSLFLYGALLFNGKFAVFALGQIEEWKRQHAADRLQENRWAFLEELETHKRDVLEKRAKVISEHRLDAESEAAIHVLKTEYALASAHRQSTELGGRA